MTDPLQRATSRAPEVLGEGCTQRYDPQQLTPEDGAEFAEAAQLWQRLQQAQESLEPPGATDREAVPVVNKEGAP